MSRSYQGNKRPIPMPAKQLNITADNHGNLVMLWGDEPIVITPHDALLVASTITGLMAKHFAPPPPAIVQPDHRLILPNGESL